MEINDNKDENIQIIELSGRLDSKTSPEFYRKISKGMDKGSISFVIDFRCLEYISSAGLRVINQAHKTLKSTNGKLMLCNMVNYIKELFEITGFDTLIPIVPDRQTALESFKGGSRSHAEMRYETNYCKITQ